MANEETNGLMAMSACNRNNSCTAAWHGSDTHTHKRACVHTHTLSSKDAIIPEIQKSSAINRRETNHETGGLI